MTYCLFTNINSWLSLALDMAQMVLDVRKMLKSTLVMLYTFCFNNFVQKSRPLGLPLLSA